MNALLHRRLLGLFALGAVHALSFAPGPLPHWSLPFVQLLTLAALAFFVFRSTSVRQAALGGALFGFPNFALGLYWLYISMHEYGGMAAPLAVAAVLLLAAGLAVFTALACALARWLAGPHLADFSNFKWQLLVAALWASSWTLLEWLRGSLFTGFPWLNIGYAHVEGAFSGWAPVVGVYGLAWFAAFTSGTIALMASAKDTANDAKAAVGLGIAILTGLAGIALGHIHWSDPHGQPLVVRLVQGNVPQSQKFDPALMQDGLERYMKLAALPPKEAGSAPSLIVLPETVIPLFQDSLAPEVWQSWLNIAAERQATILMGVPLRNRRPTEDRYTNSAIAFDAATPIFHLVEGSPPMRYDKHHLVPFGEFVPQGFRWFVDTMQIPLGDFNRGETRQAVFPIAGQMVAPNICYEDVFGEEIVESVRASGAHGPGASILINMSNLGWFGDSWALRQHLQISRMRAMETGRPMIRATNTGMTAAIDASGTVRAVLPPMSQGVLDVEVQGSTGLTPYARWTNTPVLIGSGLLILLGLVTRRRRKLDA